MERNAFIRQFAELELSWERTALINALISSLTVEEACSLVEFTQKQDNVIQRALQRKVTRDIELGGLKPCHENLIASMITSFSNLSREGANICSSWMTIFYGSVTPDYQNEIIGSVIRFSPQGHGRAWRGRGRQSGGRR